MLVNLNNIVILSKLSSHDPYLKVFYLSGITQYPHELIFYLLRDLLRLAIADLSGWIAPEHQDHAENGNKNTSCGFEHGDTVTLNTVIQQLEVLQS